MEDKALRGNAHNFLELIVSVAAAVPADYTRYIYMDQLCSYVGKVGDTVKVQGGSPGERASLLGTTCYWERLRLFARALTMRAC
jgi:hypothetical protein